MRRSSTFKKTWSIILLSFFASCNIFSSEPEHLGIVTTYVLQILDAKTINAEGLASSTFVKAHIGYKTISTVQNNDTIYGHSGNEEQRVILNQSVPVSYVFEIHLASSRPDEIQLVAKTIIAAPKQQFYDTSLQKWISAQDLTSENQIGHQRVISCRKLRKIMSVYQLTTQQHVFVIEDGILVHNANIVGAVAPLVFGACSCMHPVVATIGRTISLAKMALSIYEMYQDAQSRAQGLLTAMQEEEVVQTTRSYYETRRKDLLNLLEQYRLLKNSVMALAGQSTGLNFLFATVTASQFNQSLLPSLQSELSYGAAEKQRLLQLREQELSSIETEINSIQITLMLHLQDHVDRLTAALAELDPAYNAVHKNLKVPIPYHNRSAASNIAAQNYAGLLTLLEAVENVEQKMLVVSRLIQYYQHPSNAQILKKSTNIADLCSQHQETLKQIQSFLPKLKQYALQSQQSAYQSLTQSGLLTQQTIVNIQRNLQTHRSDVEQGHNAGAKIKQAQVTHATPPNDPDDEDKKRKSFDKDNYDYNQIAFGNNLDDYHHMFGRKLENKLDDTIENKQKVLNMVRNRNNCCGEDGFGVVSFLETQSDGSQFWAEIDHVKGIIRNCGVNKPGFHRSWNPQTGLKQRSHKKY